MHLTQESLLQDRHAPGRESLLHNQHASCQLVGVLRESRANFEKVQRLVIKCMSRGKNALSNQIVMKVVSAGNEASLQVVELQ